ncbi:AAA family ATPase [Burkholderia gladioli]|uniref:AAA family ATPase n=2 Tax=Burkholderia gladioli TaxID=28095 RepID=UPI00164159C5|nr:AAA family ATPase [Burkholderia gladioli]
MQEEQATNKSPHTHAWQAVKEHFGDVPTAELSSALRVFPSYIRTEVQAALLECFKAYRTRLLGINRAHESFMPARISGLFVEPRGSAPADFALTPVRYESIDVGEDEPVEGLDNALWLVHDQSNLRAAVLFTRFEPPRGPRTVNVEIAFSPSPDSAAFVTRTFETIEQTLSKTKLYRGKVLSFEDKEGYIGQTKGVTVHRLTTVTRNEVILSAATMEALDLHIFQFAKSRPALAKLGHSQQKGILLYGPPGTGKTHIIRYFASNLEHHTTLLITAGQVAALDEYVNLAKLLQPCLIVIEDVDLIGRDRTQMRETKEEAMLNRLLNEMDGLSPSAQLFFILTTNRPDDIEDAIAGRPGRIDQAIEIPAPDDECRLRLLELYGRAMEIPTDVAEAAVTKTTGVSAAFIKELVRRLAQQSIMRGSPGKVTMGDLDNVFAELARHDGKLARTLLGGTAASPRTQPARTVAD